MLIRVHLSLANIGLSLALHFMDAKRKIRLYLSCNPPTVTNDAVSRENNQYNRIKSIR
jgi:hypothetical protein